MTKKAVVISSSGLKNIVLNKYIDEDFIFVFGEEKFRMKNLYADFISPLVSRYHQTDPTIRTINFLDTLPTKINDFKSLTKSIITSDTISLVDRLSKGHIIEIDEDQAIKIRIISQILGNDELHAKLNELFPQKYDEENVNTYLRNIDGFYHFSQLSDEIDFPGIISFISHHFYNVNEGEFLKLSRKIQYMIISHPDLQIESEDMLYEIISDIIESNDDDDGEFSDNLFLEQIELGGLSDEKFNEFMSNFDFNNINGQLWRNLCRCFMSCHKDSLSLQTGGRNRNRSIIVGGYDGYNQLCSKPNNRDEYGFPIVYPSLRLSYNPSLIQSHSIYNGHSAMVTRDGLLKGIGFNGDGRITALLPTLGIEKFSQFRLASEKQLAPLSVVCLGSSTLYMFSLVGESKTCLVLCDGEIKGGHSFFIDVDGRKPVALFGGFYHSAAISSEGEVIFIDKFLLKRSTTSKMQVASLPDGEKASYVAFTQKYIFVLSLNGRLFTSKVNFGGSLNFQIVDELSEVEIVSISGTYDHCLAVSKDGRVFGFGSNEYGKLGLGQKNLNEVSSFTEIESLREFEIKEVYAGGYHSLFQTKKGKVLSCGRNICGQLLIDKCLGEDVYSPTETVVTRGATFCIAGWCLSMVFTGSNPPKYTPNMRIKQYM